MDPSSTVIHSWHIRWTTLGVQERGRGRGWNLVVKSLVVYDSCLWAYWAIYHFSAPQVVKLFISFSVSDTSTVFGHHRGFTDIIPLCHSKTHSTTNPPILYPSNHLTINISICPTIHPSIHLHPFTYIQKKKRTKNQQQQKTPKQNKHHNCSTTTNKSYA